MSEGKFDVSQFVRNAPKASKAELKELEERLGGHFALNCEKEGLAIVRRELAQKAYPEVNPEFLRLHNEAKYKNNGAEETIKVPRFAVWTVKDPLFRLTISCLPDLAIFWTTKKEVVVTVGGEIPQVLARQLALSTEVLCDLDGSELINSRFGGYSRKCSSLSPDIAAKYKQIGVTLQTVYQGLLSSDARTAAKEAQRLFLKKMYFAREVEPQQWNTQPSAQDKDPIMLGLIYDKCFLINPPEKKSEGRGQDEPV